MSIKGTVESGRNQIIEQKGIFNNNFSEFVIILISFDSVTTNMENCHFVGNISIKFTNKKKTFFLNH